MKLSEMTEEQREKDRAYHRKRYHANRQKNLERRREYVRTHKKEIKEYIENNKERIKKTNLVRYLRTNYGLTVEERDALFVKGCVLCGSHRALRVDHNHETGEVRGCLCNGCNIFIGRLGDGLRHGMLNKYLKYMGYAPAELCI